MKRHEVVPGTRAVWMRYVRKWGGAHRQAEEVPTDVLILDVLPVKVKVKVISGTLHHTIRYVLPEKLTCMFQGEKKVRGAFRKKPASLASVAPLLKALNDGLLNRLNQPVLHPGMLPVNLFQVVTGSSTSGNRHWQIRKILLNCHYEGCNISCPQANLSICQGRDTEGSAKERPEDAVCSSCGGEQASEPCPCPYDRSEFPVCQDVFLKK